MLGDGDPQDAPATPVPEEVRRLALDAWSAREADPSVAVLDEDEEAGSDDGSVRVFASSEARVVVHLDTSLRVTTVPPATAVEVRSPGGLIVRLDAAAPGTWTMPGRPSGPVYLAITTATGRFRSSWTSV